MTALVTSTHLGRAASSAIAGGLLLLFLGAAYTVVWQPLSGWSSSMSEDISEASSSLAKLRSIVDTGATRKDTTKADSERLSRNFLNGTDDAVVVADLQTRLRSIIVARNSELLSARTLPLKLVEKQPYLGLRLQIRGDLTDVHQILHSIEYSTPYLFVDRLVLRLEETRGALSEPSSGPISKMFAELDVFGAKWQTSTVAPKGP